MSLDIGIQCEDWLDWNEPHLALEDDGYYWYLWPWLLRIREQTGQLVDLYGGAIFAGHDLNVLCDILVEIHTQIKKQDEEFQVIIRNDGYEDILEPVQRHRFENLLELWIAIVERARTTERAVVCIGD
jgi:hypothetical protein